MVLSLRGYPPSGGQVDWAQAAGDAFSGVEAILTLPNVTQVALFGTGRSASAAMRACAEHPLCTAVILLNPVPDAASDPIEEAASGLGARPLLMLVSQDRPDSQQNAQIIQANLGETASLQALPALDQTTVMPPLLDWLLREFRAE
jgi:pimeloyl-ACP methyl ester carboxylesterase